MNFDIDLAIALLERTPATLAAQLDGLPEVWSDSNEGPQTYSAFDVVGHLIHGERTDWMVRARIILDHGEARPFDPFDRWAQSRANAGRPLGALLEEFAQVRRENLVQLRAWSLGAEQLDRRGMHPALGTVTLRELLATWVVHDLTHLHQVARVMAHQYRGEVGPWSAYLGVLRCQGHSD